MLHALAMTKGGLPRSLYPLAMAWDEVGVLFIGVKLYIYNSVGIKGYG